VTSSPSTARRLPLPPELEALEHVLAAAGDRVEVRTLCTVEGDTGPLPVRAVLLGNPAPDVPAVGVFGGVHGLERIGAQVVIEHLASIVARLRHDAALQAQLERLRLVFLPVVNPVGLARGTRANGRGVDLMRNAPIDAEGATWLVGGQRWSPALPWYRGVAGAPLEAESAALCGLVRDELMSHRVAVAVDCHSGFGLRDRVWFPHARSARPVPHLAEFHALGERIAPLPRTPRRRAAMREIEPQSRQYRTHGDLWDHLYDEACARAEGLLLPLTLEIGSWRWVRRRPSQLFSRWGLFNPLEAPRASRERRRQAAWLDRVRDTAADATGWLPRGEARDAHRRAALARWYGAGPELVAAPATRPVVPTPGLGA
jgi:hypothetical protein